MWRRWIGPAALSAAALVSCGEGAGGTAEREVARLGDAYAGVELPAIEAPEIPADAPLVLFLGDSISAGLHLPAEYAFPAAAQRLLAAEGAPFRLANLGSSGDTSAGGLARLDWALRAQPDVVVVELGGNDGLRGISLASTESNLRAIIERVRAAGAAPLLLGMRMPPNLGEYAAEFDALYPRLAAALDVPLVADFMQGVGGVADLNLPDQLHPNPAGHAQLARTLGPALRQVLAAVAR
ncbi:MAG: arylesterase [Planctomycetota bacterium]